MRMKDFVFVCRGEIEKHPERYGDNQHNQMGRNRLQYRHSAANHRPEKHDRKTDNSDHGNGGIGVENELRNLFQQGQRPSLDLGDPQCHGNLFGNDDDSDRRQHSVNDRPGEEFAQNPCSEQTEQNLKHRGHGGHSESGLVSGHISVEPTARHAVASEILDAADHDDDQPRSRALNCHFRIADHRSDDGTGDRRKNPGQRRKSRSQCNPDA